MACVGYAPRMRDIVRRGKERNPGINVLVVFLVEWSDDYDASGSVKGGRSSCHCKSTSIAPPMDSIIVSTILLSYH
jgi:hypothetical protein